MTSSDKKRIELTKELRAIREGKKVTQQNMADKLGWSPQHVSRFESGEFKTFKKYLDYATALGTSFKLVK